MKEKADRIISQIKEYYLRADIIEKLKEKIKYNGISDIRLEIDSEFNEKGNYFSLSLFLNNDLIDSKFNSKKVLYRMNINKKDLSFKCSDIWFSKSQSQTIKIDNFTDIEPFLLDGAVVTFTTLELGEKDSFDCCSRYKECSDCEACVQPVLDIAMGCKYWHKLRVGVNFYKNVDCQDWQVQLKF